MFQSKWLHRLRSAPRRSSLLVAGFFTLYLPLNVYAFDFTDAEVTEDKGIYNIKFSAVIEAHPDYVRYVLDDSTHIYRLSPSIIESEVLAPGDDGARRVRTRLLNCTAVFCQEIERVDRVRMLPSGDFEAEIIAHLSEFKSGKATWRIVPMDDYSYVAYEAYLEPDFFIPPMLGTQVVIQILHQEFSATFARIEKIARINAKRDYEAGRFLSDAGSRSLQTPCRAHASASLQ